MANKARAAKAKGRTLQNWVRDKLLALFCTQYPEFSITTEDIKSQTMGMVGEDIIITPHTRKYHPYSYECKNVEKLNVWAAFDQCIKNKPSNTAGILVIKRNRIEPLVVMDWNTYEDLLHGNIHVDHLM